MFCPNCGKELTESINFCPYCGHALSTSTAVTTTTTGQYSLVLVSKGSSDAATVGDLLEDIFGYTDSVANNLVSMAPVEVAQKLTEEEARYIAQMFSEYGVQMTVTDANENYVDLSSGTTKSIFNSDGSLIATAAAVIGALTIANRVTGYKKVKKPSLLERIFRPLFTPKPPKHVRRFRPAPQPVPQPRKTIISRPSTTPSYRNSGERVQRPDNGHRGGPNGRMKAPSNGGRGPRNGPGNRVK